MYNLHDKVSRRVGTLGTTITAHCGGAIDLSRSSGALGHSLGALAEAVLEAARQGAHVAHPAGALSAAALGLGGPVVCGRKRQGKPPSEQNEHTTRKRALGRQTYNDAWSPTGIRKTSKSTSGCGTSGGRSAGTRCATCCGACRSCQFPCLPCPVQNSVNSARKHPHIRTTRGERQQQHRRWAAHTRRAIQRAVR